MTDSFNKIARNFTCEKCQYNTNKKSSFTKHIKTIKHNVTNSDVCHGVGDIKVAHVCKICQKVYGSRNGLWVHKNKGECITPLDISHVRKTPT